MNDPYVDDVVAMVIVKRRVSAKARKQAKLAAAAAVVGGSVRFQRTKSNGVLRATVDGHRVINPAKSSGVDVRVLGRRVGRYESGTTGVVGSSHRSVTVGGPNRNVNATRSTQKPQYLLPAGSSSVRVTGGSRSRRVGASRSRSELTPPAWKLVNEVDGVQVPTRRQVRRVVRDAERTVRRAGKDKR